MVEHYRHCENNNAPTSLQIIIQSVAYNNLHRRCSITIFATKNCCPRSMCNKKKLYKYLRSKGIKHYQYYRAAALLADCTSFTYYDLMTKLGIKRHYAIHMTKIMQKIGIITVHRSKGRTRSIITWNVPTVEGCTIKQSRRKRKCKNLFHVIKNQEQNLYIKYSLASNKLWSTGPYFRDIAKYTREILHHLGKKGIHYAKIILKNLLCYANKLSISIYDALVYLKSTLSIALSNTNSAVSKLKRFSIATYRSLSTNTNPEQYNTKRRNNRFRYA